MEIYLEIQKDTIYKTTKNEGYLILLPKETAPLTFTTESIRMNILVVLKFHIIKKLMELAIQMV